MMEECEDFLGIDEKQANPCLPPFLISKYYSRHLRETHYFAVEHTLYFKEIRVPVHS